MKGWLDKYADGGEIKKRNVVFAEAPMTKTAKFGYLESDLTDEEYKRLPQKLKDIRKEHDAYIKKNEDILNEVDRADSMYSLMKDRYNADIVGGRAEELLATMSDYSEAYRNFINMRERLAETFNSGVSAKLNKEYLDEKINPLIEKKEDTFITEGNKLQEWYDKQGLSTSVIPIYGIQDTSKVNAALKDVDLQDVGIMGHSGKILGGIPLEWWNNKLKDVEYRNCILGSCYGENLVPLLRDVRNMYHTIENRWYGVNPSADSLENALFSTYEETKIKPTKGKDYNISNKYKTGGIVPKAQEGGEVKYTPPKAKEKFERGIIPNIQKPNKLSNFTSGWLDKYE